MHQGKVDTGVSELPRGNELSRNHVNRPTDLSFLHLLVWLKRVQRKLDNVGTATEMHFFVILVDEEPFSNPSCSL